MHIRLPHIHGLEDIPDGIDLPQISPSTAAGIGVAIAGNILISLALNCQKLAHRRLERERDAAPRPLKPTSTNGHILGDSQQHEYYGASTQSLPTPVPPERVPLLESALGTEADARSERRWFFFRRTPYRYHAHEADRSHLASTHALMPVEVVTVQPLAPASHNNGERKRLNEGASESDYLRSKLWYIHPSLPLCYPLTHR